MAASHLKDSQLGKQEVLIVQKISNPQFHIAEKRTQNQFAPIKQDLNPRPQLKCPELFSHKTDNNYDKRP